MLVHRVQARLLARSRTETHVRAARLKGGANRRCNGLLFVLRNDHRFPGERGTLFPDMKQVSSVRLICAPSGAGKSYLCTRFPERFQDLDHHPEVAAVYRQLGERFGHGWYNRPDYQEVVRPLKHERMALAFSHLKPQRQHYMTAEIGAAITARRMEVNPIQLFVWLPTAERITRNQQQKSGSSQPRWTLERNQEVVEYFRKYVNELSLPLICDKCIREEGCVWLHTGTHRIDPRDTSILFSEGSDK
jgi:hypothetical protein